MTVLTDAEITAAARAALDVSDKCGLEPWFWLEDEHQRVIVEAALRAAAEARARMGEADTAAAYQRGAAEMREKAAALAHARWSSLHQYAGDAANALMDAFPAAIRALSTEPGP